MPSSALASARFSLGTMNLDQPSSFAASRDGRTPFTRRMPPSKVNSPICSHSATLVFFSMPAAARTETAIAKSNEEPRFGTAAGERFTVIRRPGKASSLLVQAARTREVDSLSEASGNPTRMKLGKLLEISASTSMSVPLSPKRAIALVLARGIRKPALGVPTPLARGLPKQRRHRCEPGRRLPALAGTTHQPSGEALPSFRG